MPLKLASTNLPRLIRRLERTSLYISQKSSAIAYNTGLYYLEKLRLAIENQRFPETYKPFTEFTRKHKTLHTPENKDKFWIMYGGLLRNVIEARPELYKNSRSMTSYVIRFDSETSRKIYYNDSIRPLFAPLYSEMREYIKENGRKALMEAVKAGMKS